MERDKFEQVGREYVRMLLEEIDRRYDNVDIINITIPTSTTSPYDLTATINGKVYYVENKTRRNDYTFNQLKDKGFLFAAHKNDGNNNLFAYVFPDERIVMLTNPEQLEDLTPEETTVKHTIAVDDDSPSGTVLNYNIPYEKWWIFKLTPYIKISTPNIVRKF